MNIQIPLTALPALLFVLLCAIPATAVLWVYRKHTAKKKSPLNIELLRSPGESLRAQIENTTNEILLNLILIPTFSLLFYSVIITQFMASGKVNVISCLIYLIAAVGVTIYFLMKVFKQMKQRNHLRLGYECELAVGQELNNRIRDGFHVFHDFLADRFNIDHVLVGSTGVFAIETKGRAKSREAENENWKLQFDGKKLIFPNWTETKPITQAINQAKWLGIWLQKATGTSYKVEPVLVIPGWYILRTAPSKIKVFNGKNSNFLAKGKTVLSPQQIQAIAHQLDQKCRTVTSSSYKHEG